MSKQCVYEDLGKLVVFTCSLGEYCCGYECCDDQVAFYSHWYFWLAVIVLLIFLVAAIISGYCRHTKTHHQYASMNNGVNKNHHNSQILSPWVLALDISPNGSDGPGSPRQI